jgi:NAD(P)-dependent dehydrogenase (short-subunit alcohol dehydrogenase family)
MPLFGRNILITGGTQGLGRAMAYEFTARRARVVLTGRDPERAREVARAVAREVTERRPDAGEPKVVGVACEVTDLDSVRAAVDAACEAADGITDVVANVGRGGTFGRFDRLDPAGFRETVGVNLFGTYHTFLSCVQPILDAGGGTLVGISGYGAIRAKPFASPYSSSKAAVVQLVRGLAKEFENDPLRFLVFSPGILEHGLTTDIDMVEQDASHYTNAYARALRHYLRKPLSEAAALAASLVDPAHPLPSGQKVALHKPFEVTWAMARARIKALRPGR